VPGNTSKFQPMHVRYIANDYNLSTLITIILKSDLTHKHAVLNRHMFINVISVTLDDARCVRAGERVGNDMIYDMIYLTAIG
jgi:hypothetical protein